jgi:hypothetical protein
MKWPKRRDGRNAMALNAAAGTRKIYHDFHVEKLMETFG